MSTRVLITHAYFLQLDPKQWKAGHAYPPLATLTAAAYLRQLGYEVFFHDLMFADSPAEIEQLMDEVSPDVFVVYDDGFNWVTKMCLTNMRNACFELIQSAKARNLPTIISSSDSTDHYSTYLEKGADFVIKGEAEESLAELLAKIDHKESPLDVKGIWGKKTNGDVFNTPPRPVMRDLDQLPQAAWDLLDITPYKNMWHEKKGYFSLNVATTRGCPFKCNWCAKPIYGNRYNSRSPEHVVAEIDYLNQHFQPDHLWFCDDIFGLKPGWVQSFSAQMKAKNLKIPFKIQSRCDLVLKKDTAKALAEAGCDEVWLGAESGSQKILDAMDKGITVEEIYDARQKLKAHGIRAAFFLQFGYLGETKEDINLTFKMLEDLVPDEIGVSVAYPLPGTKFYEKVKNDLSDKANWTDSDDLALMFRNNYEPSFYKKLHRYIHQFYQYTKFKQGNSKGFKGSLKGAYHGLAAAWYKRQLDLQH